MIVARLSRKQKEKAEVDVRRRRRRKRGRIGNTCSRSGGEKRRGQEGEEVEKDEEDRGRQGQIKGAWIKWLASHLLLVNQKTLKMIVKAKPLGRYFIVISSLWHC